MIRKYPSLTPDALESSKVIHQTYFLTFAGSSSLVPLRYSCILKLLHYISYLPQDNLTFERTKGGVWMPPLHKVFSKF